MAWMRRRGYQPAIVERWIDLPARGNEPARRIRRDLYGFVDLVGVRVKGDGPAAVLLVQSTSRSNLSARVAKVLSLPIARACVALEPALSVEVHGWARKVSRGELPRWVVAVRRLTLEDFAGQAGETATVQLTPRRKDRRVGDPRQRSLF